jgi:hypothetical protein
VAVLCGLSFLPLICSGERFASLQTMLERHAQKTPDFQMAVDTHSHAADRVDRREPAVPSADAPG